MADEQKGVTVMVPNSGGRDFHPTGNDVRVTDGHLYVTHGRATSSNSDIVAIYAPGKWYNVKVTV